MRKCSHDGRTPDRVVLVAPTVLDRMRREDEELIVELQSEYKGRLSFRSEPMRHPETFEIRDPDGKVLYTTGDKGM
jgi:hypothetical protein